MQSEVIPAALKKRDVVVKSRTGSGKTAAFGIPLCELIFIAVLLWELTMIGLIFENN
ncbi:hypothetical protein DT075_03880 [Bacillus licheniformis]|nr:hypothetical protein DT075_03880 [Bacillus licheniformis]